MKAYEVELIGNKFGSEWYKNEIGNKFLVEKHIVEQVSGKYYRRVDCNSYFRTCDCKILREVELEQQWVVTKEYPKTIHINGYDVVAPSDYGTTELAIDLVSEEGDTLDYALYKFKSDKEALSFFRAITSFIREP